MNWEEAYIRIIALWTQTTPEEVRAVLAKMRKS